MNLDFIKDYPPQWQKQVSQYLAGRRRNFDIKPQLEGTGFQKAVWREMMKIPFGETRTYQQLAAAIGRPKAMRAVGTACGKNRYPIIVPCHRVVATGGIGGFSLGLELKRQLLKLEGVVIE
ncbi:MAG: methylated-DNA--[protein]-cysteine S-methyltransferase [Candidatus Nomurabacteria bacterium]|jgi:O-6-methylguanine DNA methyltransferase|nr:methylated-DNA--[protein]-cysteine S-methyltransferase [Candidatus Nomurabacteria bacterium]